MPPRFAYWTIIAGGLPTAFRAAEREELLPTFSRLKEKQPDAEMKWFARGKLWDSPEAARSSTDRSRSGERGEPRDTGRRPGEKPRGRDWRPGGDHRDPRQPFKDAKKARNQRVKAEKFARKSRQDEPRRDATSRPPRTGERYQSSRQDAARPRDKSRGEKWAHPPRPRQDDDRSSSFRGREKSFDPRGKSFPPRQGDSRSRQDSKWKPAPRTEGRGTYRGEGHGDNSWKPKPPRHEPHSDSPNRRPFAPRGFERDRSRASNNQESPSQPPRRPAREPRPNENPPPSPPPRPAEPVIPPPGPPERGRLNRTKRPRR